jgi:hypothetical protein
MVIIVNSIAEIYIPNIVIFKILYYFAGRISIWCLVENLIPNLTPTWAEFKILFSLLDYTQMGRGVNSAGYNCSLTGYRCLHLSTPSYNR